MVRIALPMCLAGLIFATDITRAQTYPIKPIRMVTSQAGSGFDFATRIIAESLATNLGQSIVVDNRGGAGGILAGETVATAQPDGYTLLSFGPAMWLIQFMQKKIPYDPVKDFAPVTLAVTAPNVLVVHPSLPVKSVKELIALAKAKPGVLNYGGGNPGSSAHLAAILFSSMAGVNIVSVPYKGGAQSLTALLANEVQVMFPNATSVAAHLKSGRLRALAVTSARPSPLLPGLPTVNESGLPGYESEAVHGIFATAKTPAPVIKRLNQAIVQVLNKDDVKEKFFNAGATVVGSSPEQLTAAVKSDMSRLGKLIVSAGIRAE